MSTPRFEVLRSLFYPLPTGQLVKGLLQTDEMLEFENTVVCELFFIFAIAEPVKSGFWYKVTCT